MSSWSPWYTQDNAPREETLGEIKASDLQQMPEHAASL